MITKLAFLSLFVLLIAGCDTRSAVQRFVRPEMLQVGAVYSVSNGDGAFGAVQITAYEGDEGAHSICHMRVFDCSFTNRPTVVDVSKLAIHDADRVVLEISFWNCLHPVKLTSEPEPDGPANGSQPIRSETNQPSSAASSRR